MSRLRVGIVGAGNVAATVHLPGYSRLAEEVEIVALCDTDLDRARQLGARFGVEKIHASFEEMLAAGGLDAISVCVANRLHAPLTLAALGAGLHVFCEKPPALNPAEAEAMAATAEKAERILAYDLHWRFSAEAEAAKAIAQRGELGRIYAGRVRALRRRGIPAWGSFTDKAVQGGGPLMDIGVHMLDLALDLLGWPELVSASAASYAEIGNRPGPGLLGAWDPSRFGVEDALFGFLRFEGGASLLLETSFALNMKEKSSMQVELYGSLAGLSLFPLELYGESGGELCDTSLPFLPERDPHFECLRDFVRACREGRGPRAGGVQGAALQLAIAALYRSAELGEAVSAEEARR